jgi:SAM-dependent methyltransferase
MLAKAILHRFLIRPAVACRSHIYQRRFTAALNRRTSQNSLTPRRFLVGASDQYLLWVFANGPRLGYGLDSLIPQMPDDNVQRNWTGNTGETTLREALHFFQIVCAMTRNYSREIHENSSILDYGCGWGRIIRFFLRDVDPNCLYGCDCYPKALEIARSQNRWCNFELIEPFPPTSFVANKFDIIYLFSVFSHLSEELHLELLQEFHRILRPGGVVIATTRPRSQILRCERIRRQSYIPVQQRGESESFVETEYFLDRYDRGLFCHSPAGGGGVLEPSFYGESCIPREYVERVWTRWFDIMEYRYADRKCVQNTICCRKRL